MWKRTNGAPACSIHLQIEEEPISSGAYSKKKKSHFIGFLAMTKKQLCKKCLVAIGHPIENLPRCPYLCSDHFDLSCFNGSVESLV